MNSAGMTSELPAGLTREMRAVYTSKQSTAANLCRSSVQVPAAGEDTAI